MEFYNMTLEQLKTYGKEHGKPDKWAARKLQMYIAGNYTGNIKMIDLPIIKNSVLIKSYVAKFGEEKLKEYMTKKYTPQKIMLKGVELDI